MAADNPGAVVSVGTGSTVLLPANAGRGGAVIHNLALAVSGEGSGSAIGVRFAGTGAAAGAVAFYLEPGEAYELPFEFDYKDAICAYHTGTGAKQVAVGDL